MKLPAAAYSAEAAASAAKVGSYGVFGDGEYIISHQNLQSKSLQPIYLSSYLSFKVKSSCENHSQGGVPLSKEEWEGGLLASCARATRTIGMCSFDARNRGSIRLPLNM